MSQSDKPERANDVPEELSVAEWRAKRATPAGVEATAPDQQQTITPPQRLDTLADRIQTRRATPPPSSGDGEGEGGGDEGQQQTVARTPLFTTLGIRSTNAGQDIPTPKPKSDPDRPSREPMGSLLDQPTPPTKRKHGR